MANKIERPSVKRAAFLAAYSECGIISAAARISGVARSKHYVWMNDAEYAEAFEQAHQVAIEVLEEECRRRAKDGVAEPVVYQGQFCYEPQRNKDGSFKYDRKGNLKLSKNPLVIWKKSDVLLMFLLKALNPDKYRENVKAEITGSIDIVERLNAARERLKRRE